MEKRRKFQGVLNILSFNRHFYVIGLCILLLITIGYIVFDWSNLLYWIIIALFVYGLIMPLLVSAYVYDFSGYYNFNWLDTCQIDHTSTKKIININAGFDETSFIIRNVFPKSNLSIFDFYNAKKHTEPAIIRARKVSLTYPNTQNIESNFIPLKDKSVDVIFLLSAIHEIRSPKEKVSFLKECHRVCKSEGKVIMVEHLRDLPNFLAFSIGFTHFFSNHVWKKAFKDAGFSSFTETKFTSFMSIFNYQP
ncbi:methyltransferase type 11 [Flavivirga aquatica]|uniref:Methyltransferase type 11 n=1 Tax=Flavivirga aquatica TaxID=1849968 RepID=A0A1E5T9B0_9FLAO|nr:methyltransferase domain-containing protein [Flavivirga aquatica]OEK07926.1 methyltransferase type 11 [Flavivirga aquatica]